MSKKNNIPTGRFKWNENKWLLSLLFIVSIIAISCSKPECGADSDCSSKKCFSSKCENDKCLYRSRGSCCGNKLMDSIEDDKPGNKCTCPSDYGKCEGRGKIKVGLKTEDAKYMRYYCSNDEQCVLGAAESDIFHENFLDTMTSGFFKASSIVKYNTPFDINNDAFEYTINLEDANKNLAFPIELKKIRLMLNSEVAAEMLIAEQELGSDISLNDIGDKVVISVPLNLGYKPREIEQAGVVRYIIDYTYTKNVPSGKAPDGTTIYSQELVREKFNAPSKKVFFIRTE